MNTFGHKPRLLLTGASGFLGHHIIKEAQAQYQILGVVLRNPLSQTGVQMLKLDISQPTSLRNIVRETRPDCIIHTAANSDVNYCQQHPAETAKLNVDTTIYLAKLAAELGIPFVFTSSDMVFDGTKGNYTETDAANPLNLYGEQKAQAEEGVLAAYPLAAVCRMPLMYGIAGPTAKNFFSIHLEKLKRGEELSLFTDEWRTPLSGTSAAKGLLLAANNFHGLYHLGGRERISRYGLGQLMAEAAHLPHANIKASRQADVTMAAPRPADVSMNSDKAMALGFAPLSVKEELGLIFTA